MDDTAPTRYRRVALALWGDERFRDLSPQQPSGQTLWIYLLTGPHTTSVPGLSHAGEALLTERLGWSRRAFRRCWDELARNEMAQMDHRTGVLWVGKAIYYNQPANPNVVRGWREPVALIPSCQLKTDALSALREHCRIRGLQFLEAFDALFGRAKPKRFGGPLPEPSAEPLGKPLPEPYAKSGSGTGTVLRKKDPAAGAAVPLPARSAGDLGSLANSYHQSAVDLTFHRLTPDTAPALPRRRNGN